MKKILEIRKALDQIPYSRKDFTPEDDFRGNEKGVKIETIWGGDPIIQDVGKSLVPFEPENSTNNPDQLDETRTARVSEPKVFFEFGAAVDDMQPYCRRVERSGTRRQWLPD